MLADLHFHSKYSDGALTIPELIDRVVKLKLEAVCLTDHDTIAGQEEFNAAAVNAGLRCLCGLEISTYGDAEIHILGYNYDNSPDSPIYSGLKVFSENRALRIGKILNKLRALGVEVEMSEIDSLATVSRSRTHIAQVLVNKNYVKTKQEAMDVYLGEKKLAWVDFYRVLPEEAVRMIVKSGGVAVLAHPGRISLPDSGKAELVKKLKENGLKGIETFYPSHTKGTVEFCRNLAKKYNLINTTGSDYHSGSISVPDAPFTFELEEQAKKVLF